MNQKNIKNCLYKTSYIFYLLINIRISMTNNQKYNINIKGY